MQEQEVENFFLSRKLSEVVSSHPNNDQCSAEEIILTTLPTLRQQS